jgi:hypothetical protein
MKFLFRWKAFGHENEALIEAENYPMACFQLGLLNASEFQLAGVAGDFELDLTKPVRVDHSIPPMVDPLGRYWDQPSREKIAVDEEVARMTQQTLDQLAEYSCTIPTGTYAGKMWKRREGDVWLLCWYEDDPRSTTQLFIRSRKVILVEPNEGGE